MRLQLISRLQPCLDAHICMFSQQTKRSAQAGVFELYTKEFNLKARLYDSECVCVYSCICVYLCVCAFRET